MYNFRYRNNIIINGLFFIIWFMFIKKEFKNLLYNKLI